MSSIQERFNARSWCRLFFRKPEFFMPFATSDAVCLPCDPHVSWEGVSAIAIGLDASTLPPDEIDFHTPRTGRVIQWESSGSDHPVTLAMYPAHPDHDIIPPCPGPIPERFERWAEPTAVFTDGSRGRWDFRRYPQLWDPLRPWIAFTKRPVTLDDPNRPEVWPTTSYFRWNNPRSSECGGYWIKRLLRRLFERRQSAEEQVYITYQLVKDQVAFDRYKDSMPHFDPLELEHTLRWSTWREGREWATRTAFYVAELLAFDAWMKQFISPEFVVAKGALRCQFPLPLDYNGTWAQGIRDQSDWLELMQAGVPIYILMAVPIGHPLERQATRGSVDNDERYRHNAFDASLNRHNSRIFHKIWKFPNQQHVYKSNSLYLPQSIFPPSVDPQPQSSPSTSWNCIFTSCIFLDRSVFRNYRPIAVEEQNMRLQERTSFAVLHPTERLLSVTSDPHPVLRVLPSSRDHGVTYFREVTDNKGHYWVEKLEGRKERLAVEYISSYLFDFSASRVAIYSEHPFPGKSRTICRYGESTPALADEPDNSIRHYYSERFTGRQAQEAGVTWRPEREHPSFIEVTNIQRPSPYPISKYLPRHIASTTSTSLATLVFEPWSNRNTNIASVLAPMRLLDSMHEETVPIESCEVADSQRAVSNLSTQRRAVDEEARRRFFWPKHGEDWRSTEIVQWVCPEPNFKCYPLRISNWHGDTSFEELWEILQIQFNIDQVLVVSWYHEIDTTITFNLGLRYAEDTLKLWSGLHGVQYRNRLVEAYPVKAVLGKCYCPKLNLGPPRPSSIRAQIVQHILYREHRMATPNVLVVQNAQKLVSVYGDSILSGLIHEGPNSPPIVGGIARPQFPYTHPTPHFDGVFGFTKVNNLVTCDDNMLSIQLDSNCGTSSFHAPDDLEEGEVSQRRKKKRNKRKSNNLIHKSDYSSRANASDFDRYLKYQLIRGLWNHANILTTRWKGLVLPAFPKPATKSLVDFFHSLWLWIDGCHEELTRFRDNSQVDYDFSSFDAAFSDLVLSRSLQGRDFTEVLEARQDYERKATCYMRLGQSW